MKKITLLFILMTSLGYAQNLISNGTFDDGTGWTVINHYEAANTLGSVTFSGGAATFNETAAGDWKHMGIYTSLSLDPGLYQFDMSMAYTDINDCWGEVYIGAAEPVQNADYSGDQQVLKAYNAWDCPDVKTYSGLATASGCDGATNPGQFEITTSGTYYILFRTGGSTYGSTGIVIDNMSLLDVTPAEASDASLSDLMIDGETISGFASGVTSYNYDLPFGTTTVPTVTVTTTGAGASSVTTPASGVPGTTTISVTSEDMSSSMDYTVAFTATLPNTDAPDPTYDQANANAIYSDLYTAPVNPNYNPGWGQATVMTEVVINGNNTLKYAGLNYQGTTFDAMDVSGRDYFHFDYWTSDGTQFRASPISQTTGEVAYIIENATQNQWVSVDVPLSYFIGINPGFSFADIFQFKFDTETFDGNGQGAGNASQGFSDGTFYIDNVYFYSGEPLNIDEFQISNLNVFPNPTSSSWNISTENEIINEVQVFDLLGKRVISLKPNALSVKVNASNLRSGIYITKIITASGSVSQKLVKE
jgi:hypothetical protein